MNDLISIIVPVYNVEKYLNKCVDSILKQTYTNMEVILVDDGSKDKSGAICDEYEKIDSRVRAIHKQNGGVCSARNVALSESKGEWVAFIDSDDWIESDYVEQLYECAVQTKADVVACGYNRVTGKNKESINNSGNTMELSSKEFLIKVLNPQTGMGFCHMKLYSKESLKGVLFDTNLVVGEDALFNEQVVLNIEKVCMLEKSLYNYRINLNSVVKRYDKEYANKYLKSMKVNKEYLSSLYENDSEIMQNYYNFVAFHVLLIAVNYCFNEQNRDEKHLKSLKRICNIDIFKTALKNSNYDCLSLTRKITLFTIKCKLYFITELICKYRQKQNRRS